MKRLTLLLLILTVASYAQDKNNLTINNVKEEYLFGYKKGDIKIVQKAEQDCQNLISLYETQQDKKNLIRAYTLLGRILVDKGNFQASKTILILAYDLSLKELGAEADETLEAKKYLSWAYGYLQDSNTELKYSLELLESYKKNETKYFLDIADVYNTIGMNYGARNNRQKEQEYLFQSKEKLEQFISKSKEENVESEELLANVLNSISQSFLYSFDYHNAIIHARRSLLISEKIAPNNPQRAAALASVGRCIYALEKNCDSAIYYLDNALKLLELNNMAGNEIWLSYRTYKTNILARCGNRDGANKVAIGSIDTMLNRSPSCKEALIPILIQSQNIDAELSKNELKLNKAVEGQTKMVAYMIAGGLLVVILLILIKIRLDKQKALEEKAVLIAKQEARIRMSKDVHDELGSTATAFMNICSEGLNEYETNNIIKPSFITKVESIVLDLKQSIDELQWTNNPDYDNTNGLFTKMTSFASKFLDLGNRKFNLNFPEHIESFYLNPETIRSIYYVFREALNNIVKYSEAKEVTVDFIIDNDKNFRMTIKDDGKGFDKNIKTESMGLKNFEYRAGKIVNGKINIESTVNKGTTITLEGFLA